MGKLGKKSQKKNTLDSIDYNISIVTPTVKSREKCLLILAENISNQTYVSKIKEWIIVSADPEWSDTEFKKTIAILKTKIPNNICIISAFVTNEYLTKMDWQDICSEDDIDSIGNLRNISNKLANGDYIVCMDDDDYYPKTRVEIAVASLYNSNKLVAGCSNHLLYDVDLQNVYQFKKVHNNHSLNNALAYKKQYLLNDNKYDSTKRNGEEKSFLNDFSSEMIQLDPIKTILQIIHSKNTWNKREYIIKNALRTSKDQQLTKISSNSNLFIPKDILHQYYDALNVDFSKSEYDVVYYMGKSLKWSPYDTMLNESHDSIKNLVECWTKNGLSVAIYGNFEEDIINKTKNDSNTGNYLNYLDFKCSKSYDVLILWQESGINPVLSWKLNTKKLIVDLYDVLKIPSNLIDDIGKVNTIVVKSKFHAQALTQINKLCNFDKKFINLPSGIRKEFILPQTEENRNDFRFVWYASFTRGIIEVLAYLWPLITEQKPEAELHIYPYIEDKCLSSNPDYSKFENVYNKLKSQSGVIEHDAPTLESLITEFQTSSYHLYLSKTPNEVDALCIRESLSCGCIPIITEYNVFAERNGIKLPGDPTNVEDMKNMAKYIIEILDKKDEIKELRNKLIGHDINWQDISNKWQSVVFIE